MASVIALSIFYIKHYNKHNNQQCNIKAIMKKKDSNPCVTWSDLIYIYKFDNKITFKHQPILLFWYLENFLEKDKTSNRYFMISI